MNDRVERVRCVPRSHQERPNRISSGEWMGEHNAHRRQARLIPAMKQAICLDDNELPLNFSR